MFVRSSRKEKQLISPATTVQATDGVVIKKDNTALTASSTIRYNGTNCFFQ
jgi:hypothetical protein